MPISVYDTVNPKKVLFCIMIIFVMMMMMIMNMESEYINML